VSCGFPTEFNKQGPTDISYRLGQREHHHTINAFPFIKQADNDSIVAESRNMSAS